MDDKDKYILELEEKVQALEMKINRLEIEGIRKNTRGAGKKAIATEALADEVYKKHIKGESIDDLAETYNVSKTTIYKMLYMKRGQIVNRKYNEEEVTEAVILLKEIIDIISDATFECGSPVPESYDELIRFYDKRVCGIDLKKVVNRVSQKYDTLQKFMREEDITFKEPLSKLFNVE